MRFPWGVGVAVFSIVVGTPLAAGATTAAHDGGVTTRVSVSPSGGDADGRSTRAVVSDDGSVVVFESTAHNLVPGDSRRSGSDIYWVKRADPAHTMRKVSTGGGGVAANGNSHLPSVSGNGRYVVFSSDATNLVAGAVGAGAGSVYRWDATTGRSRLVTVTTDGAAAAPGYSARPTISANGRFVEFYSQACNLVAGVCPPAHIGNLYVRDMASGTTRVVTRAMTGAEPNGDSVRGEISANGRYVVFESAASNLVTGDGDGVIDIFGVPLSGGQPGPAKRLSVSVSGGDPDGASGRPTMDDTGHFVAYESWATDLVPGDTNGKLDAFVVNTVTLATTRISVSATGAQLRSPTSRPALSGDGMIVAFVTGAPASAGETGHSRDVYIRDWRAANPTNVRASVADPTVSGCSSGGSVDIATRPSLAGTIGFNRPLVLGFVSSFCNLVPGDGNGAADAFTRVWSSSPF